MNEIKNSILDEIYDNAMEEALIKEELDYHQYDYDYFNQVDPAEVTEYLINQNIEEVYLNSDIQDIFNKDFVFNEHFIKQFQINLYCKIDDLNPNSKNPIVQYIINAFKCLNDNELKFVKLFFYCHSSDNHFKQIHNIGFELDIEDDISIDITEENFNDQNYPEYVKSIKDKILYLEISNNPIYNIFDVSPQSILSHYEYYQQLKEVVII